jgi:hypothetical protein
MRSPFFRTGVAIGVLAILGAYIYFVEQQKPPKDEKVKQKAVAVNKAKVRELILAPAEGETIRVVKDGTAWRMETPLRAPADTTEAEAVLTALEGLEIDEVITDNARDLAPFGLDRPRHTLSVLMEGGSQPVQLLLGARTPDSAGLYAKLPGSPRVFTVAAYQEQSLTKKPFDLRDRDLLKVKRDAVRTLEIAGPEGEAYALSRDDKGDWVFTRPLATRAGRWAVDGLLGTLESLRVESVASEDAKDLKPFGLAKPARSVTLGLADGTTKTLQIGSSPSDKKYHAREAAGTLIAVIPGALVDDLAKGMKELRQKRLGDIATYDVEGIEIEDAGKKLALARAASKDKDGVETQSWKRTAPAAKDVDRSKVDDALFKLSGLEVQEFLDKPQSPASYGLDAPAAKVTLKMGTGKPLIVLVFGRKEGSVYSRRPGDDAVLKLDAAKVDEALKALREL